MSNITDYYHSSFFSSTFLLDVYTGAAVAYSLRKLKATTTNVIRVRRSSDNSEQDFTPLDITDGTLTTFTGAGYGYVTTWYDQSGNGLNATQSTASLQPEIVNSGVVNLENGKPTVKFDGSNDNLTVWNNTVAPLLFQSISDYLTILTVEKSTSISGSGSLWYNANTIIEMRINSTTITNAPFSVGYSDSKFGFGVTDDQLSGSEIKFSSTVSSVQRLSTSFVDGDDLDVFLNSSSAISTSFTTATSNRSVGSSNSTFSIGSRSRSEGAVDRGLYAGNMQEIIIYPSNEATNRVAIESNINTEYTIY
jgi:hypothetical protein